MIYSIYELVDPRSGQTRYVGKTNDPARRLVAHISSSGNENACNPEKKAWIQELLAAGMQPKMNILEEVEDVRQVKNREKHWIQVYVNRGIELLNVDGVETPSPKKEKPRTPQGPSPLMQQMASLYYKPGEARKKLGVNITEFRRIVNIHHIQVHINPLNNSQTYRRSDIDKLAESLTGPL